MNQRPSGIRFIPGHAGILVAAPHGPVINGEYKNDLRTGIVTLEIQRVLGCTALVNDRYFKPKGDIRKDADKYFLDLFRIDHARKVPEYVARIQETVERPGKTLVLWVHGIADDMAVAHGQEHIAEGLFSGDPEEIHAFIGYGQGGDPKAGDPQDRFSARQETVEQFRDRLTAGGMTTLLTRRHGANYRGRDSKRFNQWFLNQGYGFVQVESLQLEIRQKGFRDTQQNAIKTGGIIAGALTALKID